MKATRVFTQEEVWNNKLHQEYDSSDRTGTHVSDLTMCLRKTALSRLHNPVWETETLYRFTMGRSLEKAFFTSLMPEATQELEVEKEGVVGHIDFAGEEVDYECKATWSRELDVEEIFLTGKGRIKPKDYWVKQAGAYTHMRGRTKMNFIVFYLANPPKLRCYQLEWTEDELHELWSGLIENKNYLDMKDAIGELPYKPPQTWQCNGCSYRKVCDESEL